MGCCPWALQELEHVLDAPAHDEHYGVRLCYLEMAERALVLAQALLRSPK